MSVRVGIIGAGAWAVASHLPSLARRGDVSLVAACRKGGLGELRREWGFAVVSEDHRDVLDAGLDACIVASPGALHHEHAAAALDAGCHVLVEKPFTLEVAHAWDLVARAQRAGRHLLVAFGWNYRPIAGAAQALMSRHGVGEVEHVLVHMGTATRSLLADGGGYGGLAPDPRTWTDPAVSGGGYAQAQLSHALGLALWLTGLRGAEAYAALSSAPVELHDAAVVRFANGAVGALSGSSTHGGEPQLELRVVGAEGQLQLDIERSVVRLLRPPKLEVSPALPRDAGTYACDGPVDALIDLASGREVENRSPGELGARVVELIEACYRSARSGVPARVDRTEIRCA